MTVEEFIVRYLDVSAQFTEEQCLCAAYLESRGKRLLMNFGFHNAPEIAWDLLEQEYGHLVGPPVDRIETEEPGNTDE